MLSAAAIAISLAGCIGPIDGGVAIDYVGRYEREAYACSIPATSAHLRDGEGGRDIFEVFDVEVVQRIDEQGFFYDVTGTLYVEGASKPPASYEWTCLITMRDMRDSSELNAMHVAITHFELVP